MQHTNENEQNTFEEGVNIGYSMGFEDHAEQAYCSGYYDGYDKGFEKAVKIIEDKVSSLCNVRQVMEYLRTLKSEES